MMPTLNEERESPSSRRAVLGSALTARPPGSASLLSRFGRRFAGPSASVLLHGLLVLTALLSTAAPRIGRGGGTVGSGEPGSGALEYTALLQPGEKLYAGPRAPDERVYPHAAPEPTESPEPVPPPSEDFLRDFSDSGLQALLPPPATEPVSPARSKDAYAKLPPPAAQGDGRGDEVGTDRGRGGAEKGNSDVNGSGGDTGGAGDGTEGALYMPAPLYPPVARRKGIEGTVVVEVDVHADGRCENPRVAVTSGHEILDQAAASALGRWKYEPRADLAPVVRRVRFVFKLQK